MEKFKQNWQITKNWQLVFPIAGIIILFYSAYKLANAFLKDYNIAIVYSVSLLLSFLLLKLCLALFKKLEGKWILKHRWEMIRVFMVFAFTGSSSVFIGRPIIKWLGVTQDNLYPLFYWIIYILLCMLFYQILLVCFGWLLGQFEFFWNFEKKMLKRFGLKRFID
ncbi:DUF6787 family protein [Formosa sp. S-31]|uniref:DUF6787 family protein n=1 Tax=Formosa sp. S-31 TaxID=2790949 RepID=UPI003EBCEB3E